MLKPLPGGGYELRLYIQPGASRDQLVGLHDGAIKIAIKAPPVEGKANAYLQQLLADWFGVRKNQLQLIRGELNRQKTWHVSPPCQLPAEFSPYLESS
ncbi:DUF167 domain-containing protein [Rheinheimera sp.]|uniref:DUF167 domain-containing protein n=1 Tax=Rheinheimera sp. TaxID=1869214 RepID=UPI003AF62CB7